MSDSSLKDVERKQLPQTDSQESFFTRAYIILYQTRNSFFQQPLADFDEMFLRTLEKDLRQIIRGINENQGKSQPARIIAQIQKARQILEFGYKDLSVALGLFKDGLETDSAARLSRRIDVLTSFRRSLDDVLGVWPDEYKTSITFQSNVPPLMSKEGPSSPPEPADSAPRKKRKIKPVSSPEFSQQFTFQDYTLEKHAASDKPIQTIPEDKLGFATYVNALHSFILSKYTGTPLTISVDGQWGTGKSSLMYMLKNKLNPNRGFGIRVQSTLIWWRWFLKFLIAFPIQLIGKVFIRLAQESKRFEQIVMDINQGLSISSDALQQLSENEMPPRVMWWAKINVLCERMDPPAYPTVWLNAWKFDNQEEVWAALALAALEQLKEKHNLLWRLWFWWDLTFSRFSVPSAVGAVFKQFLLPLLFAIVASFYDVVIASFDKPIKAFLEPGQPLLWAGFIVSGIVKVAGIFKDPFQISLDEVFDRPNYREKVGFLARFEKDFAKIVRSASKNGFGWGRSRLVIFIDDLDRCEPPKAADVIEAISLFLDAEDCVFVVGMDSNAVAMSIEAKYKDLFERMKAENAGVVSLGRAFLEKIVQIPFTLPLPTSDQILIMVEDMLSRGRPGNLIQSRPGDIPSPRASEVVKIQEQKEQPKPLEMPRFEANSPTTNRVDVASLAREPIREAIRLGTELLSENPRQVKTFINLFRLYVYIRNERRVPVSENRMASWVACTVRWQNLVKHLYAETQMNSLSVFLYDISKNITSKFRWKTGNKNVPVKIKNKIKRLRQAEKNSEAHWCNLPWEWWLLEPDFLRLVKLMDDLWAPPPKGKSDELKLLLTMGRSFSAMSDIK